MGRLRSGVCQELEDAAWAIIAKDLEGVTSQEAKKDILTPWKEKDRLSKEVYNSNGFADTMRRGMYHRAYNRTSPHLNSTDCTPVRVKTHRVSPHEVD
ncbi:DUF7236 family protein [Dermacoccus nishinomiyaensis]|uniref:DUF7236 family protein n=1 Tax=Dermacoccus nishinomiyaensis TaxID=1274 RepID=UPI00248F2BE7|nr:hypothetical protein [Dermacoccus nishinomiyaensis]